jgi:hypothetical protein
MALSSKGFRSVFSLTEMLKFAQTITRSSRAVARITAFPFGDALKPFSKNATGFFLRQTTVEAFADEDSH